MNITKNTFYKHIGILVAFYILFQSSCNLFVSKTLWPYLSGAEFVTELVINFTAISIIYVMNYAIVFMSWKRLAAAPKLLLDVLCSFTGLLIIRSLCFVALPDIEKLRVYIDWTDALFDNIFILIGIEIAYFVRNHIWRIQEISESKQKIMQYQNDALRAQVDPHFLFNTLNMLYSLVGKDTEKSKLFIVSLSKIYRYMLDQQGCEKVPLSKEVQFVKEYAGILAYRYNNKFEVQMSELPARQEYIIPFTLQLLVENAVKHNKISVSRPMVVAIRFEADSLTVSNRINRKDQPHSSRIGLEYLRRLYKTYGKQVEVTDDDVTFTVKIPYIN